MKPPRQWPPARPNKIDTGNSNVNVNANANPSELKAIVPQSAPAAVPAPLQQGNLEAQQLANELAADAQQLPKHESHNHAHHSHVDHSHHTHEDLLRAPVSVTDPQQPRGSMVSQLIDQFSSRHHQARRESAPPIRPVHRMATTMRHRFEFRDQEAPRVPINIEVDGSPLMRPVSVMVTESMAAAAIPPTRLRVSSVFAPVPFVIHSPPPSRSPPLPSHSERAKDDGALSLKGSGASESKRASDEDAHWNVAPNMKRKQTLAMNILPPPAIPTAPDIPLAPLVPVAPPVPELPPLTPLHPVDETKIPDHYHHHHHLHTHPAHHHAINGDTLPAPSRALARGVSDFAQNLRNHESLIVEDLLFTVNNLRSLNAFLVRNMDQLNKELCFAYDKVMRMGLNQQAGPSASYETTQPLSSSFKVLGGGTQGRVVELHIEDPDGNRSFVAKFMSNKAGFSGVLNYLITAPPPTPSFLQPLLVLDQLIYKTKSDKNVIAKVTTFIYQHAECSLDHLDPSVELHLSDFLRILKDLKRFKVFHGDIKPPNILIMKSRPVLGDMESFSAEEQVSFRSDFPRTYLPPDFFNEQSMPCVSFDCYCMGKTIAQYMLRDYHCMDDAKLIAALPVALRPMMSNVSDERVAFLDQL